MGRQNHEMRTLCRLRPRSLSELVDSCRVGQDVGQVSHDREDRGPAIVTERRIPSSTKSGTVYHFTAVASGSRYTSAPGTACESDLTRIDFDVMVE